MSAATSASSTGLRISAIFLGYAKYITSIRQSGAAVGVMDSGLLVALGLGMTSRFACYKYASDGSEVRMVPFFVQIKCQLGKSYEVANRLADAEIASEIYSTAGDFDLLVKFYVEQATDIGHFIAQKVQTIPGIADTRTIITFKAFGGS
jgi:DNA-binding Lrp family transcriptional regulator